MKEKIKMNPMYGYLLLLAVGAQVGLQSWRSLYNNFAVDIVKIDGFQTGIIQSVRELPGFLSLLVVLLLIVIKEHRLAAMAMIVFGFGIFLTGMFPTYSGLIITTFIMSLGFHYLEATNQSMILQNFEIREAPIVIGHFRSIAAIVNIGIGVFIWLLLTNIPTLELSWIYYLFGILTFAIGIYLIRKKIEIKGGVVQKKKIQFKKKYWLYYILSFFSGARRQIFVVFAIFLLVQKYNFSVQYIAILFVLNNIVAYFLNPLIGKAINKFGERKVLSLEYIMMILVFLGYALIDNAYFAASLYIIDHIFFSFAMALNTFMQKIAEPEDIASTVTAGFTINHLSAVVIPVLGGILWLINPQFSFYVGVVLAMISLFLVQFIDSQIKIAKKQT